jgi:two-component system OmpR family response regulator
MTGHNDRLLIVDEDTALLADLAALFGRYGLTVDPAPTIDVMRARLARQDYALVVLDPAAGADSGLLHELAIARRLPVIVHSASLDEAERIAALEMGAEDCLRKPAHPRELLARIRAALRTRHRPAPSRHAPARSIASFQGWRVDLITGQLFSPGGAAVTLSDGEFQLLRVFLDHPREVLDRARLLDRVHGPSSDHYDRAIDVQLCRLRRKLSAGGLKGPVIRTIRNEGYMFVHPVAH